MQVRALGSYSYFPPLLDARRQIVQQSSASAAANDAVSAFSAEDKSAVLRATGGVLGEDGVVDFTVGAAAGRNLGKIPEGATHVTIAFEFGTVEWYGAAGPSGSADGPGQNADRPQGTLTGMRITTLPGTTSEQRQLLLSVATDYVDALNTGRNLSWAPHALFDIKVGG